MSDPTTAPADNLTSQPPPSSEAPAATLPSTTQPQPPPQPARADNQSPKPEAQSASTEQKKDAVPDANRNEEATIATAVADKAGNQEEPKLSGTELKKRAKAEKAARRAREKEAAQKSEQNRPADADGGGGKGGGAGQSKKGGGQGPRGSVSGESTANTKGTKAVRQASAAATEGKKKKGPVQRDDKTVAVFGHLGGKRRSTIAGLGKEIHPAILSLGLQLVDYVICGSSARCMATLLAFKRVIESYVTPAKTSLARHLTTHLSHQITYLASCRPLSISQGNSIRATKLAISSIDPSTPDIEAKSFLCEFIDNFIREKFTLADRAIADSAASKIKDGDVIICYASSSVVQQTLLQAHSQGKKFRVSIIDSRPLFEGKSLAHTLTDAGLEVQYSLVSGLHHAMKDATKVFLGAHALTSNGRLYSRVGTALVAMSAKERAGGIDIPVIVCCETIKFTDRVALDSIVVNEVADADELVPYASPPNITSQISPPTELPPPSASPGPGGGGGAAAGSAGASGKKGARPSKEPEPEKTPPRADPRFPLQNWREKPNVQLLNIMYDVTPADCIDMVITEMGSLPPSAVPVVHRMSSTTLTGV